MASSQSYQRTYLPNEKYQLKPANSVCLQTQQSGSGREKGEDQELRAPEQDQGQPRIHVIPKAEEYMSKPCAVSCACNPALKKQQSGYIMKACLRKRREGRKRDGRELSSEKIDGDKLQETLGRFTNPNETTQYMFNTLTHGGSCCPATEQNTAPQQGSPISCHPSRTAEGHSLQLCLSFLQKQRHQASLCLSLLLMSVLAGPPHGQLILD